MLGSFWDLQTTTSDKRDPMILRVDLGRDFRFQSYSPGCWILDLLLRWLEKTSKKTFQMVVSTCDLPYGLICNKNLTKLNKQTRQPSRKRSHIPPWEVRKIIIDSQRYIKKGVICDRSREDIWSRFLGPSTWISRRRKSTKLLKPFPRNRRLPHPLSMQYRSHKDTRNLSEFQFEKNHAASFRADFFLAKKLDLKPHGKKTCKSSRPQKTLFPGSVDCDPLLK